MKTPPDEVKKPPGRPPVHGGGRGDPGDHAAAPGRTRVRPDVDRRHRRLTPTRPSPPSTGVGPAREELAVAALARFQAQEQPEPIGSTEADLVAVLGDFRKKLLRPNGMAMIGTLLAEEPHTPKLLALFREKIVAPRRDGLLAILKRRPGPGGVGP